MEEISGVYQHFKGNMYEVIGSAIHTETEEAMVVYKDKNQVMFVRPFDMFFEKVDIDGTLLPRFRKIDNNNR